jgi:hypothetical protein
MIMIIEPDSIIRRKLGDMLNKERFMAVSSITDALEKICLHKNEIDLIVTNVQILRNETKHQTIAHLCEKLCANKPPMLCIHRKGEECREETSKAGKDLTLIEYDEKDPGFPVKYLLAITERYPEANVDIRQATAAWHTEKETDDLADLHKWLQEEGLSITDNKRKGNASKKQQTEECDYRKMYAELKEKYDKLLAYMRELLDSVKDKDG